MRPLFILSLLLLSACAQSGEAGPPGSTGAEHPDPTLLPQPVSEEPMTGDALTGILGADTVEGGCGYLRTDDGTRYEVIYPEGWRLSLNPLQLTAPDGEVVARGGDEVTVRGREANDMGSICQIGPIFEASAVER